jgi:hypothetical protein
LLYNVGMLQAGLAQHIVAVHRNTIQLLLLLLYNIYIAHYITITLSASHYKTTVTNRTTRRKNKRRSTTRGVHIEREQIRASRD